MFEDWAKLLPEELLAKGAPVDSPGPFETAWPIAVGKALCDWFSQHQYSIDGGEIYSLQDGIFTPHAEGWSCQLKQGESWEDFCVRSVLEAQRYLVARGNDTSLWFTVEASNRPGVQQLQTIYAR